MRDSRGDDCVVTVKHGRLDPYTGNTECNRYSRSGVGESRGLPKQNLNQGRAYYRHHQRSVILLADLLEVWPPFKLGLARPPTLVGARRGVFAYVGSGAQR